MATGNDQNVSTHLVDDFESAFQNCITLLTSQEHFNVQDSAETKMGVDNSIQKFLESARQMESFFLNKRLILSVAKPEHVLSEDITDLKAEIDRKEKLIEKHHEKLTKWQTLLRANAPLPVTQQAQNSGSSPYAGQSSMETGQGHPSMQQRPVMMTPGQYPGPPAGHPGQFGHPPPPAYPLAYLERMGHTGS